MDTKKIGAFFKDNVVKKRILHKSSLLKSLRYLQEQFPDGKQEQICQISVYLFNLLNITMLR